MNKMISTFVLLTVGVMSLALFVDSAYAQQPSSTVGGMPVPIDNAQLFAGLIETNLIWIAPAAVGGIIILKLKLKRD